MGNAEAPSRGVVIRQQKRRIENARGLLQASLRIWINKCLLVSDSYSETNALCGDNPQSLEVNYPIILRRLPKKRESHTFTYEQFRNQILTLILCEISTHRINETAWCIPVYRIQVTYERENEHGYLFTLHVCILYKMTEVENFSHEEISEENNEVLLIDAHTEEEIPGEDEEEEEELLVEDEISIEEKESESTITPIIQDLDITPNQSASSSSSKDSTSNSSCESFSSSSSSNSRSSKGNPCVSPNSDIKPPSPLPIPSSEAPQQSSVDLASPVDLICKICMSKRIDIAFVPCGHTMACSKCSTNLKGKPCPICRQRVRKQLHLYIG